MNSNYCPKCGNGLAAYQNGFCVVCERNRCKVANSVEQSSIDSIAEYVKVISSNVAKLVDIFIEDSEVNSYLPIGSGELKELQRRKNIWCSSAVDQMAVKRGPVTDEELLEAVNSAKFIFWG